MVRNVPPWIKWQPIGYELQVIQGINCEEGSPTRECEQDVQKSHYEDANKSRTNDSSAAVEKLFYVSSSTIICPYDACLEMVSSAPES